MRRTLALVIAVAALVACGGEGEDPAAEACGALDAADQAIVDGAAVQAEGYLDDAIDCTGLGALQAVAMTSGQACVSATRMLVPHERKAEAALVLALFQTALARLRVRPAQEAASTLRRTTRSGDQPERHQGVRPADVRERGPAEQIPPELLGTPPLAGVPEYHHEAAEADVLVLAAVVRLAVDHGVVEDQPRRGVITPVVRRRAERPVGGHGGIDVIPVEGERQRGTHELEPLFAAPGSPARAA